MSLRGAPGATPTRYLGPGVPEQDGPGPGGGVAPDDLPSDLEQPTHGELDAEEEARGLVEPDGHEDLGGLDDDPSDDDAAHGGDERDLTIEMDEEAAHPDDDAKGPRGADGADPALAELEGDEGDGEAAPADDEDDAEVSAHEDESGEDDQGSEGIAGEDPSAAIDEAPALDGAEGEGEGLGEPLPELEEDGTSA